MSHAIAEIKGEELWLLKEKAIYWPDKEVLIIADLHFGKVSHFRKSGIGIPIKAIHDNWRKFIDLLTKFSLKRVVILGDLFHSDLNNEWYQFLEIITQFDSIEFDLVLGNHDILDDEILSKSRLNIYKDYNVLSPFVFIHDEKDKPNDVEGYILCGHIHPSIKLVAPGMRPLKVACFHFNQERGVVPAFGNFVGYGRLKPKRKDEVYIISDEKVVKWSNV